MNIRKPIIRILLTCALLSCFSAAYAQNKPNIVLVFMDNFGWGEPGFNGCGIIRGAVAGDSESALYVQAVLLRHFGSNVHLDLRWRYYDIDYESGSGVNRFKWDVTHSGPVVGFSWEFGG